MATVNIRPLHDRVIVQRSKEEEKTAGGIILTDSAKEKPVRGKVIAIGTGKLLDSGEVRPLDVKVGNEVLFGKYAGQEVKINDTDYLVMREEDIMGVIEA
jgi:chaperonin GroES